MHGKTGSGMEGLIKKLRAELADANNKLEDLEIYLLDDRDDFLCCSYCELVRHSDDLVGCDMNADHQVCGIHESIKNNDDGQYSCIVCIQARKKKASKALVSLSVSLKRNHCHKDVYENIFIPLMKKMREDAKKNREWD